MYKPFLFFCFVICISCNNDKTNNKAPVKTKAHLLADSAGWPGSFGFGQAADTAIIAKLDIDVRPDGKGLPAGGADAVAGKAIYTVKCMACHGGPVISAGVKFAAPPLIDNPDSPRVKTIGNYWPYATTIFDYVRRSMPYNAPGSLTDNEVYALTAYLLHENKLLDSTTLLNATLLPTIVMPAQKRFIADDRHGGPEIK